MVVVTSPAQPENVVAALRAAERVFGYRLAADANAMPTCLPMARVANRGARGGYRQQPTQR
jgi:hypothetical protein